MTRRTLARAGVAVALLAGLAWAATRRDLFTEDAVQAHLELLGPWAPLAFVGLYALAALLFLPGSVLTLAGGALFGPVAGTLWSLLGATIGATLSFLAARHVAGDAIRRKAGPRLDGLLRGVEREGWRFVALVRLVPLFPFNLSNYALGLTRIRFLPYVLATGICMLPGAAAFAFAGHSGRSALGGESGALGWALAALGLLAVLALVPGLIRRRRAPATITVDQLRGLLAADVAPIVLDVRSHEEFDGPLGHVPTSTCVPLDQLEAHLSDLVAGDRRIVTVCLTDKRSTRAAQQLLEAGAPDVVVLAGGMTAWNPETPA